MNNLIWPPEQITEHKFNGNYGLVIPLFNNEREFGEDRN